MECVLLLLLLPLCWGHSEYQGKVMIYYNLGTNLDGSIKTAFRYKSNTKTCLANGNSCPSDGCFTISNTKTPIDNSPEEFCQIESIWTRKTYSDAPFTVKAYPGNEWSSPNVNGVVTVEGSILVDMRLRSDTGQGNRCPQTTIPPVFRVPWNCPRDINLLSFDPDGDQVRCRFANDFIDPNECVDCTPPSVLSLQADCSLLFSASSESSQGRYAVQLVMEDLPQSQIILTDTSGVPEIKDATMTISKIPVHFLLSVESASPSCFFGLYLPRFVTPTPKHGTQINVQVNETLYIHIEAKATYSTVSELLFSGPSRMTEAGSGGSYVLSWTPVDEEEGQSHPVCFSAQANYMTSKFTSLLRCVVLNVNKEIKEVKRIKVRLSSFARLSEEATRTSLLQQVRMELDKNRLPSDVSLSLVNSIHTVLNAEPPQGGACSNY